MICPGKKGGNILTFKECAEKAQKYHTDKMWTATLPYYGAMLELTERSLGLFHPQVANVLSAMHTCYSMMKKYEQSIQCMQRVLLIREFQAATDPEKPEEKPDPGALKAVFSCMGQLAELYSTSGNVELAKEMLVKTEEIAKEMFGEESFERGRALCALAGCHDQEEEKETAVSMLLRAIELPGYAGCTEKSELVAASVAYYNLGFLYRGMEEKKEEARTHLKKSLEMKIKGGLAADHPDIIEIKALL